MSELKMIFTRSPADVSPDTWLTKAQYSSVQLLAPQTPKQWDISDVDLVREDSRRVAKTGYLFSELEPELRPTHNPRNNHDSWRYTWNALMRHPAVKGCIKKWDATMSTVGTQAAYMPGDVFDIQYNDVPTMALERMQPSNGTDCSDAFITQRAAMLTGCMFRALAKLLYGTNLSSLDHQPRQRFAIPLVPTKWSRSLPTGTPDTPKSTAWSKHDVINRKAVQGHVQSALFHNSDAMFHGKLEHRERSWEIYSCNNFVWLKAKREDQKHRTYPWPDEQTQTFVVAPLAQSLSAGRSSGPVASLYPLSTDGAGSPKPIEIGIVEAVNIANDNAQLTSAPPERVIAAKKRIEEAIKYAVTNTPESDGRDYAISIFKTDTSPDAPPSSTQIADSKLVAAYLKAAVFTDTKAFETLMGSPLADICDSIASSPTGSSFANCVADRIGGGAFIEDAILPGRPDSSVYKYEYISFPAVARDMSQTGTAFYRPQLFAALNNRAAVGSAKQFEDTMVSDLQVMEWGADATATALHDANIWWNDN